MKVLLYTDVHWCASSSIVRGRGDRYSERLENCIRSVNFAEKEATDLGCDAIACLGDFFDRNSMTDEEISAMNDIRWAPMAHMFLVGNHDSGEGDLRFSTTQCLSRNGFTVISKPEHMTVGGTDFLFLPFIGEDRRASIGKMAESMSLRKNGHRLAVLSHNDIKGIRYGKYLSDRGYELKDISDSCDLFINGHLHNGSYLDEAGKILNLGNLTGLNFSEDASVYQHLISVLDTDALSLTFIENPFAYNFYKIDIEKADDLKSLNGLKNNAVLSVSCMEDLVPELRKRIDTEASVAECRIISHPDPLKMASRPETGMKTLNSIDYMGEFDDFVKEHLGDTDKVREELKEISLEAVNEH